MTRTSRQSASTILLWPLVLASLSLAGLLLGLTGDGWRDVVATALLALPLLIFFHRWARPSRRRAPVRK